MKRYTLGFVIIVIAALSFFMHRASIRGAENSSPKTPPVKSLTTLTINVNNQSNKDIKLIGTYKSSIVKSGEAPKIASKTSNTIKAKSKGTVIFEPKQGFDWLEVKQATNPVVPLLTAEKPLTTQSIVIK